MSVREGFKKKKKRGNFPTHRGSKKCFNVKKLFFLFSGQKKTKKGNCQMGREGGVRHQGVNKNFFAFLDDSDHV